MRAHGSRSLEGYAEVIIPATIHVQQAIGNTYPGGVYVCTQDKNHINTDMDMLVTLI